MKQPLSWVGRMLVGALAGMLLALWLVSCTSPADEPTAATAYPSGQGERVDTNGEALHVPTAE